MPPWQGLQRKIMPICYPPLDTPLLVFLPPVTLAIDQTSQALIMSYKRALSLHCSSQPLFTLPPQLTDPISHAGERMHRRWSRGCQGAEHPQPADNFLCIFTLQKIINLQFSKIKWPKSEEKHEFGVGGLRRPCGRAPPPPAKKQFQRR